MAKVFDKNNITIFHGDFLTENLDEYTNKINLIITSPPYNANKDYDIHKDNLSWDKYIEFTQKWLDKCFKLLAEDGRICINIPITNAVDKNNKISHYSDVLQVAKNIGFKYRHTILWYKPCYHGFVWGSFMKANCPNIYTPCETILVMYKGSWYRNGGTSTISKGEFKKYFIGFWKIPGEQRVDHPAPFPEKIPYLCIQLFSFQEDIVLDPFVGSGTTLLAAVKTKRKCIGVEISRDYINTALERLKHVQISIF